MPSLAEAKQDYFYKSGGTLVEAKRSGGNSISVVTKFSSEQIDLENDRFLKSAWTNQDDVDHFMRKGLADWNHLYVINKKIARECMKKNDVQGYNQAETLAVKSIVGQPDKLYVEKDGPYCKLKLYANNEFVKAYEPALMAGSDRFGVSAAGRVIDKQRDQQGINVVTRARLSQISICPLLEAVNDDTTINLVKSAVAEFLKQDDATSDLEKIQKSYIGSDIGRSPLDQVTNSLPQPTHKLKLIDFIFRYLCTQKAFAGFVKDEVGIVYGRDKSHANLQNFLRDCFSLSEQDAAELAALAMVEISKK